MNPPSPKNPRASELLPLLAAVVLVVLIAGASYRAWSVSTLRAAEIDLSEQIFLNTQALLSSLKDAETGQRGFLLTGSDEYLEPYRQALAEIPGAIDRLAQLVQTRRPDQAERVQRLRPVVQSKLDELSTSIQVRRTKGMDAALGLMRTGQGRSAMDQIRAICEEIESTAKGRLAQFSEEARASSNQVGLLATVGSLVLLGLLISSFITIRRATARRVRLIEQLQLSSKKVAEARDWLQTTLASIGDGVIATDANGRVTLMNGVAEELTGWQAAEAEGKPLEEIFVITNEQTGAAVENPVARALREGRIVGLANHTELTPKGGVRRIPIDDSAAPIREHGGTICGVVLVFRDVTERKEAERFAEKSVSRFRIMADNAPVLVWMSGPDRLCTWFNKPWLEFTGREMEKETGLGWTENLHPEDHERSLAAYRSAFQAREPFQMEYRLKRHDGSYRWLLDRGVPLHDESGGFMGYVGTALDITDRIETESELRRANADLSQFAFAASHDLQEPLRMIATYAQLLVRGYRGQLDGAAAEWVGYITEGTTRMRDLLSDLLDYTRVNSEERPAARPIDLNEVFEKATGNLRVAIEESGAAVTRNQLPVVQGQEGHFLQLFQNLIDNGIKYRRELPPRIQVSAARQDGAWRVAVADNGIGVEPEYHESIFGVFKRLHGRTLPGTGIGLAICQRVVERYGGRIWVESDGVNGSTFYFTLPVP
jgi:PAS domain S-box-containing protein